VLAMTPREIMYAVLPAMDREDVRTANALLVSAVGANNPKLAGELMQDLEP
jgi:hypothetical protein